MEPNLHTQKPKSGFLLTDVKMYQFIIYLELNYNVLHNTAKVLLDIKYYY